MVLRRRYTKERFAFSALTSIIALAVFLGTLTVESITPWNVVASGLSEYFLGRPLSKPNLNIADYILLLTVFLSAVFSALYIFRNWDGLRSVYQHEIEQRHQAMSLLKEGMRELQRIIKREFVPIYESKTYKPNIQISVPSEYVSWRHRARELVQLRWSYYSFSQESGWLEDAGCWLGNNINNDDIVLLRCTSDALTSEQLKAFVDYSDTLKERRNTFRIELIVAVENESSGPAHSWPGNEISFHTESTLLDGLIDWTDYRNDIRKRMVMRPLPDSKLTITDVFVQPYVDADGWDLDGPTVLEKYLEQWLDEPGQRQLALLGDYGQGKSTATLAFVYKQIRCAVPRRVPILIELRGKSPRNMTPLDILAGWCAQYNINPRALLYMHMSGRLLLIFEGFDEVALVGDAEMRIGHFKTLWEFCYPNAKILITGRPNFFFDDEEMTVSLGLSEAIAGSPYCRALRLRPFELCQIRDALRAHDDRLRNEICGFAGSSAQFMELISRPSLLYIVSILWNRERLSEKLGELTSAYVMNRFIQHSYLRQGQKEGDPRDFMALNTAEREYFMKGVATYMAANRLPNQIRGAELNEVVALLIDSIPDLVSASVSPIHGDTRRPLRIRISESEYGVESIQTDVRTCGILIDDPSASGAFRFGHKSFMEYLFAEVVAGRILDDESPDAVSILGACRASAGDIASLPVSTRFLSEILARRSDGSAGSVEQQRQLAERILSLLIGGSTIFGYVLGRYELFKYVLRMSLARLPIFPRVLIHVLFDPLLFLYGILMTLSVLSVSFFELPWLGISLALIALSVSAMWMVTVIRFWPMRGRLDFILWNRICKDLGFCDRVLFQITNNGWLPWNKGREFDFFPGPE